jgi:hypothetical protein
MNVGTCWGKNTIGSRARSVEKAPGSDFTFTFIRFAKEELQKANCTYFVADNMAEQVMELLPALSKVAEPDNLHLVLCNDDSRF